MGSRDEVLLLLKDGALGEKSLRWAMVCIQSPLHGLQLACERQKLVVELEPKGWRAGDKRWEWRLYSDCGDF
jgi:hypothetical protein